MPHLSEVQKKYKDKVTVLAISDEDLDTVSGFMKKPSTVEGKTWGEAMAFTVATDPDAVASLPNQLSQLAGFVNLQGIQWDDEASPPEFTAGFQLSQ